MTLFGVEHQNLALSATFFEVSLSFRCRYLRLLLRRLDAVTVAVPRVAIARYQNTLS